jgi:hypothetical protein
MKPRGIMPRPTRSVDVFYGGDRRKPRSALLNDPLNKRLYTAAPLEQYEK